MNKYNEESHGKKLHGLNNDGTHGKNPGGDGADRAGTEKFDIGRLKREIDELEENQNVSDEAYLDIIRCGDRTANAYLFAAADRVRRKAFGKDVYIRGLIEISNYCRNDCYYCGIRRSNGEIQRYRLSGKEILQCAREGYELGFRTFVLQGGEDAGFSDSEICRVVENLKSEYADCAVTLSIGEKTRDVYADFKRAGADRYLLRHETADRGHYAKLHPKSMDFDNRLRCLYDLRDLGFQVGAGLMVGSPFQEADYLITDIRFMQDLKPHMIGVGPFVPHHQTPFADCSQGSFDTTLNMLAVLRLTFPRVLLPATTALGSVENQGRESGLKAGCNVIMPNLSPQRFRKLYELYDNKLSTGAESAQKLDLLRSEVKEAGYEIVVSRGDSPDR